MSSPCGRSDCPIEQPTPVLLDQLGTITWPADARLHRGHLLACPAAELVPGLGTTRFAPLPGLHHTYLSQSATAGLLESALHELSGPDPTIYLAALKDWALSTVTLAVPVILADLRDAALTRLGVARTELVDGEPVHYACTRRWAAALQTGTTAVGAVDGLLWHSRQADLHARSHRDGLLADLLTHRATEVAVLWRAPAAPALLQPLADPQPLVAHGRPARLVVELSALTGAPIT